MRPDFFTAWRRTEPQRIGIGLYALHAASISDAVRVTATDHEASAASDHASRNMLGIEAVSAGLSTMARAARVRIEVDAAWARLFVLPWSPALSTARRWDQFAASRFAQRYDCASEDWALRVLPAQPPHARLVVALPRALVEACVRVCGKRLAGLEVGVLTWLQAASAAQRGFSGCRAEIDDLQAWIFVFQHGALVRVRARRERAIEALVAAIEAEWAASVPPGSGPQACTVQWGPRARAAGLDREAAPPALATRPPAQPVPPAAAQAAVPA